MKKAILIFIFFVVLVFPSMVNAQEDIIIPTQSISPTPSASPKPTDVSYDLPYPGLLPGTPLYLLKSIRDKMIEITTAKPLKKSSFYLLQADKRLAASLTLFIKGQDFLAETTLSKGQNYLEKSLDKSLQAKNANENIEENLSRIQASSQKQSQEIKRLLSIKNGEIGQKLKKDYIRALELQKRAERIKP